MANGGACALANLYVPLVAPRRQWCVGLTLYPWPLRGHPQPPIEPVNRSRSNPQLSPREAVVSLVPSWGDARRSCVLRDCTECSPFRVVTRVVRPVSTSSRSIVIVTALDLIFVSILLVVVVTVHVVVPEAAAATRSDGATTVRPSDSRT